MYKKNRKYYYSIRFITAILVIAFLLPLLYYPAKTFIFYTQEKLLSNFSKDSRQLTKFSFTEKTLLQVKFSGNRRECLINGMMYDIYSVEKIGDIITIKALADHKETVITKSFKKPFEQERDTMKSGILHAFTIECWQQSQAIQFNLTQFKSTLFSPRPAQYATPYSSISSPPPKI